MEIIDNNDNYSFSWAKIATIMHYKDKNYVTTPPHLTWASNLWFERVVLQG